MAGYSLPTLEVYRYSCSQNNKNISSKTKGAIDLPHPLGPILYFRYCIATD